LKCTPYSEVEYKVLVDRSEFHWFCKTCEEAALHAVQVDQEIEEKCKAYMTNVTDRIEKLETTMSEKADKQAVDEIKAKVDQMAEATKTQTTPTHDNTKIEEDVAQMVRDEMEEREQIEAKKLNIVVQNLPEHDPTDTESRDDLQKVNDILDHLETPANITSTKRMGRKVPDRKRTLMVTVSTTVGKKAILAKAKNLRHESTLEVMQGVYIRPDLTQKQQLASKNLRADLKEIRDRFPEDKWTIRHNRIVKQDPEPAT
jgi:hypothetical protein